MTFKSSAWKEFPMVYFKVCFLDGEKRYTKVNCKSIIQSLFHVNHAFFSSLFLFTSVLFSLYFLYQFSGIKNALFMFFVLCWKGKQHFCSETNEIQEIVKTIQSQQIMQFHVLLLKISVAFQLWTFFFRFWDSLSCILIIQFSLN